MRILLPREIAETCFLIEALLSRAVGRLPLMPIQEEDEIDAPAEYPDIVLTREECRTGGLEPDPEWEELRQGKATGSERHWSGGLRMVI